MNKRVVFLVIIMLVAIPYLTNTQQDRSLQLSLGNPPPPPPGSLIVIYR